MITLFISVTSSVSLAYDRVYSKPASQTDWNVLIITMDTTRADHLGCYGYKEARTPNIDSLATQGVRFANAYTPAPLTLPAHCSIFTGKYPFVHHVRNNGSYYLTPDQKTLAEILKENGFAATEVFGRRSFAQQPPIGVTRLDIFTLPASGSKEELGVAVKFIAA